MAGGESELCVTWLRLVLMKKGTLAADVENAVPAPCASWDAVVRAGLLFLLPSFVPEGGMEVSGQLLAPHRSITLDGRLYQKIIYVIMPLFIFKAFYSQ